VNATSIDASIGSTTTSCIPEKIADPRVGGGAVGFISEPEQRSGELAVSRLTNFRLPKTGWDEGSSKGRERSGGK